MNDAKKEMLNYGFITFIAGIIIGVLVGFCVGRGNVSDKQDGTEQIEYELDTAFGYQQSAKADIERAERYAESSKVRLGRAAECAQRIEAGIDESSELIAECQQIIARVQARGTIPQEKD